MTNTQSPAPGVAAIFRDLLAEPDRTLQQRPEMRARIVAALQASAAAVPVAHLKAKTSMHTWGGFEACSPDDGNAIPVFRTPAPGMAGGVVTEGKLRGLIEDYVIYRQNRINGPELELDRVKRDLDAAIRSLIPAAPHPSPAPQAAGAETEKAPRMNIFSQRGTQVMFDAGGGYPVEIEHAKKVLTVGVTYTVERTEVGGCSSSVFLKGIDRGWNTVMFAAITASGRDAS